jgi:predicted secreted protein
MGRAMSHPPLNCLFALPRATLLLALAGMLVMPATTSCLAADDESDAGVTKLHLVQSAERMVRRDRIRAQLRVESVGSDARQVQAEINKRMTAALDQARAVQGIKLETGGYSVYEERQTSLASRWHGSQGLSLSGDDFGAVLGLAGSLQNAGLAMSGLSFELAPETARGVEDELTTEALARLRQRAERIAGDLQMTVDRLRDVRVGNVDGQQPRPQIVFEKSLASTSVVPPPVGEAGDATVRVSVEAEILLGPVDPHSP